MLFWLADTQVGGASTIYAPDNISDICSHWQYTKQRGIKNSL